MFLSGNKKNDVYPCKPQFYNIKVGFKGVSIILARFRDVKHVLGSVTSVIQYITIHDQIQWYITKTRLFKYKEHFTYKKLKIFSYKTLIFFIFLLKT